MSRRRRRAFEKYGARFLARGGPFEGLEGKARARNVIIEFPSLQAAHDCYHSPEYQAAAAIRHKFADAEMVLVEGPEPTDRTRLAIVPRCAAAWRCVTPASLYCIAAKFDLTSLG